MPIHMRLPKLKGFRNRSAPSTRWSTWPTSAGCSPRAGQVGIEELVTAGAVRKNTPGEGARRRQADRQGRRHRPQVQRQRSREDYRRRRIGYRALGPARGEKPDTPRTRGVSGLSRWLCPVVEAADTGHATAAALRAAMATRAVGSATAAALRTAAAARAIGRTALAAAGVTTTADPVGATIAARACWGELSDRITCRPREVLRGGHRCRGDSGRGDTRKEQRGDES